MEITKEVLEKKRAEYEAKIRELEANLFALQGAIQSLNELDALLQDALTLDQFAESIGAKSAEVINES